MIYRIVDEHEVEQCPLHIEVDGQVYTNQSAEDKILEISDDWYPLVQEELPDYNPETQYLLKHYEQEADCIRLSWIVQDIIVDNIDANEYIEAAKILMGEDEDDNN